jgi:glycosyltransferase involved in cell wall biosynthesis
VKRRILHVSESATGGIGVIVSRLAPYQAQMGAEVAVAMPSFEPLVAARSRAGVRPYAWEAVPQPGAAVPRELAALRAIIADFDPSVVHLHSSKAGFVGRLLVRGRRPTVFQPHAWAFLDKTGAVGALTVRWERFAARWTDAIVCVSEDEYRAGRSRGVKADYRVLPNGVDLEHFRPGPDGSRSRTRGELGLGEEPLAVCLGRLHRQKNQGALLDAWPRVRAMVPDARLVLVGDGPDREALKRRGEPGVELAGPAEDVRPWLDAASVVVQPSRWEGMSLSVLEAMAMARSVIATDVTGMRELIDGDAGAVVAPGQSQALAEAIAQRLASPELADAEGRVGRRRVEERHDLAAHHEAIDRVYDELLAPRVHPQRAAGRLRVLVVHPYGGLGGAESWLLRLLDVTPELDVRVILLKDGPFRSNLEERGITVEAHPVGRGPADILAAIGWLSRRLRAEPPDVVLGNGVKAQLVSAPAARIAGIPTVWAKHDHSYDRTLALPLGRLSTGVIGAVEELAAPVRRRDAVIIPPPRPETEPAARAEARDRLAGLGVELPDAPTLAMVGRLIPFKGVDDAIRALALPEAAGWRLVVVGNDDEAAPGEGDRLRALASELGVEDRVVFVGHLPGIAHWLAGFDALAVLTKPGSRRAPRREGFGTTAFEAMLAGVPVIAAEGGAVARRLEGRAGVAVPPGDPRAVAGALQRLSDPQVRKQAGRAAREIVASHPSAEACGRLLVDVLRAAAGSRRR